eukprot:g15655.t1
MTAAASCTPASTSFPQFPCAGHGGRPSPLRRLRPEVHGTRRSTTSFNALPCCPGTDPATKDPPGAIAGLTMTDEDAKKQFKAEILQATYGEDNAIGPLLVGVASLFLGFFFSKKVKGKRVRIDEAKVAAREARRELEAMGSDDSSVEDDDAGGAGGPGAGKGAKEGADGAAAAGGGKKGAAGGAGGADGGGEAGAQPGKTRGNFATAAVMALGGGAPRDPLAGMWEEGDQKDPREGSPRPKKGAKAKAKQTPSPKKGGKGGKKKAGKAKK